MNLSNKSFAIQKMITAAYLKIFLNYSQTISIINSLHLNWNNEINYMFNLQNTVSGSFQNVISVECLMNGNFNFITIII